MVVVAVVLVIAGLLLFLANWRTSQLDGVETPSQPAPRINAAVQPPVRESPPILAPSIDVPPEDTPAAPALSGELIRVDVFDELTSRPVPLATLNPLAHGFDSATTSTSGEAELDRAAFVDGVSVEANGYLSGLVHPPNQRSLYERVWLAPARRGRGLVVMHDGAPVAGAHVVMSAKPVDPTRSAVGGGTFGTTTGEDGTFEFPLSNRGRDVTATSGNMMGTQRIEPGADSVRIVLTEGAILEVLFEGENASSVNTLEVVKQAVTAGIGTNHLIAERNEAGVFRIEGLTPRSFVELTTPEVPGGLWTARLEGPGIVTRLLIVLDGRSIEMQLNWVSPPPLPIATVKTGLHGGGLRPTGKVIAQDKVTLPESAAPFPFFFQIRFLSSAGDIVGFSSHSYIKMVSEGKYVCEAFPLQQVSGRVLSPDGTPAAGATVRTYTEGRTSYRDVTMVTGGDGRFTGFIDNRFDFTCFATDALSSLDTSFPAKTTDLGDIKLSQLRTVKVHLTGGAEGELYFIAARNGLRTPGWPAPLACYSGESVDVPVSGNTRAIQVEGRSADYHQPLTPGVDEYHINLAPGSWSITLRAVWIERLSNPGPRVETPMGDTRFSIGPNLLQEGVTRYVTTNDLGEAVVTGVSPGALRIGPLPHFGDGGSFSPQSFTITRDGETVTYSMPRVKTPYPEYVAVTGRITPAPATTFLRVMAVDRPLPHPMDGREIRDSGIKSAIVIDTQVIGTAYSARMHPDYRFTVISVVPEGTDNIVYDNAGYLVRIGDAWRADLVRPDANEDRISAQAIVSTAQAPGAFSPRLKVLWIERGNVRSQDVPAALNREIEVDWPRSAERVWLIASARNANLEVASIAEARAGTTTILVLLRTPVVIVSADGLAGRVALTPEGIPEREWVGVASAGQPGRLRIPGAGRYEFAGIDETGRVRTKAVVVAGNQPELRLSAADVLQGD